MLGIGRTLGGTIGHIVGEQIGGISSVLLHNARTWPFIHTQRQAAFASGIINDENAKRRERSINKKRIVHPRIYCRRVISCLFVLTVKLVKTNILVRQYYFGNAKTTLGHRDQPRLVVGEADIKEMVARDDAHGCASVAGGRTPGATRIVRRIRFVRTAKRKKRIWWPGTESNCRHRDFQSPALPTELPGH